MSIFVGSNEVTDIKIGSTDVQEVYVGATRVWLNVPNINFAPNQWTVGAAGTVWTLTRQTTNPTNPYASFDTTYVNLPADVLGTFPSYTYGGTAMEANNIALKPSTNYQVTAVISFQSGAIGYLRVYDNSGTQIASTSVSTTGTFTATFTTDATGSTDVHIQSFGTGTTDKDIRVTEVYLEAL